MVNLRKLLAIVLWGLVCLSSKGQVNVLPNVEYLHPLLNRPDNHSYGIGGGVQIQRELSDSFYGLAEGNFFFVKGKTINDRYFKYDNYNVKAVPISMGIGCILFNALYIEASGGALGLIDPINEWGWQVNAGGGLKFQKVQVGLKAHRWNTLRNFNFVGIQLKYKL